MGMQTAHLRSCTFIIICINHKFDPLPSQRLQVMKVAIALSVTTGWVPVAPGSVRVAQPGELEIERRSSIFGRSEPNHQRAT